MQTKPTPAIVEIWMKATQLGQELGAVYLAIAPFADRFKAVTQYETSGCRRIEAFKNCFADNNAVQYTVFYK